MCLLGPEPSNDRRQQGEHDGDEEHRDQRDVEADAGPFDSAVAGEATEPGEGAEISQSPQDDEHESNPNDGQGGRRSLKHSATLLVLLLCAPTALPPTALPPSRPTASAAR